MQKNSALVQGYFNRHKDLNEMFFVGTIAFKTEADALTQLKQLKNPKLEVVKVTRAEAFAGTATNDGGSSDGGDTGDQGGSGGDAGGNPPAGKKSVADYEADVAAAEAALATATEAKDEEAIATAKRKLQTAKMQLGKAKSAAEKAAQQ